MARLGSARVAASENVRQLETLLYVQMLSITLGTVDSIMHSLGRHNVAAHWIPRLITYKQNYSI